MPSLRRLQHEQAERVPDLPALPVELLRVPADHQDGDGEARRVGELLHGDPDHSDSDSDLAGSIYPVAIGFNIGLC